ncbi:hypothetical protein [Moraxella sp. ZY200743]|uniref:hypothetical protein n=1 Tax=Moraxella sp. ZY200743 TaxID=2911970 RepID=UPI003D7D372F
MSNQIGKASILLTADTASFETSMGNARATAGKTFGDIKADALDMGKQVKAGFAIATAAFAAASATIGVLVKDQMELASALSKTATIAGTSATHIQKYIVAAKAMGIEQDKLGDIFKDTQDKVGDFLSTGGGELADFFENIAPKVGITAKELRQLSGPDALQAVYDALEKANISQSEMIFYMESIADEASLLIPLLADAGAGFDLWGKAAENAGAVMDEKTIRATQELNTATQILDLSYQGVKNQIAVAVMPVLSDLAGSLVQDASLKRSAAQAGEVLAGSLKLIVGTGRGAVGVIQLLGMAIGGLGAAIANPLQAWEILSGTWDDMKKAADNTNAALDRILNAGNNGVNPTVKRLTDITVAADKATTALGKTGAEEKKAREAAEKAAKTTSKQSKSKGSPIPQNTAKAILWGAQQLGINPNYLASVISFETSGTFSTSIKNPKSSATGLIQFMQDADGTSHKNSKDWDYYGMSRAQFGALSAMEQMQYVVKFFKGKGLKAGASLGEVYDAVIGTGYRKGTQAYELNRVWDTNKNGIIEKGESIKSGAFKNHIKNFFPNVSAIDIGEAETDAAKILLRAEEEAEREAKRQADARYNIEKSFSDKKTQLLFDYQEQEKKIKDAAFGEDEKKYLDMAKARYENELAWLELEKDKKAQAAKEHLQSEEERIRATAELERREVTLTVELDEELRKAKIDAITHAEIKAIDKLRQAYQDELDQINSHNQTQLARIRADFAKRRRELANRDDLNQAQKDELGSAIYNAEAHQVQQLQKSVEKQKADFLAELGGYADIQNIQNQYQTRLNTIQGFLDAEVATVEEAEKMKQMVRMQYAQVMLGSLAESSKAAFGEQSRAYKAMFAMSKGVAIAQAGIALWQNIAQASKIGFPQNIPLIAQAMTQGMGIIAHLKAIKSTALVGQAHDGIMSVPKSGTWNLEKGERVLPKHTAKALDDKLNSLQGRGETKVIINNYTSEKAHVQQMPNGDMMVTIGKMISDTVDAKVNQRFIQARRQGGELYGR